MVFYTIIFKLLQAHDDDERFSFLSDTVVETVENPSIVSVIDMLTQDLMEFADIGDASEMSEIENKSLDMKDPPAKRDENNNECTLVQEKDVFTSEKAAQKLWDLLKILHDKVKGKKISTKALYLFCRWLRKGE